MKNSATLVDNVNADELLQAIRAIVREELEEIKLNFQPKQPEEYLTRAEVVKLLKIDLSTVHNWAKKGKLLRYGIGNRVYFKRSEIEEAMIAFDNHDRYNITPKY
jgi:excisionase family DNA binding protein